MDSLIDLLKEMEIYPCHLLAIAGCNSEDNYFKLKEELNCSRITKPKEKKK